MRGYYAYIKDIYLGKTKPHIFSWVIRALLNGIGFFGLLSDGAGMGARGMGAGALLAGIITILSLKHGEKDIQTIDWYCIIGCGISLLLWYITSNALYTMLLITIIDLGAFLPTVLKTRRKPHEETIFLYIISMINFGISVIVLEHYSLITAFYPAALVFANAGFVLMTYHRRKQLLPQS